MPVFDSLSTGNNNVDATFGNEEADAIKQEAIAEQQLELSALLPNVQQIRDTLDAEIAAVSDIRSYIKELGSKADWDAIASEYRARELYIDMITRLKMGMDDKVGAVQEQVNG